MDFSQFKSRKFWVTVAANGLTSLFATFGGLDPDVAAKIIAVVSGGYVASQGLSDYATAKLGEVKSRLMSRKLWVTAASSILTGLLVSAGADPVLVAKLIGGIATVYLGSQGFVDMGKAQA